jgi:hypothetical protein
VRIRFESVASPDRLNDDYAFATREWAVVLDGATALHPESNGCIHNVPWLVRHLAGNLAFELASDPQLPLNDVLASAITSTRAAHEATCDLNNPDSPSSTVTILRERDVWLDYLVLGDSPLLLHRDDGVEAVIDDRMARLDDYSYDAVIRAQNRPGGYYIASTMADAAYEAVSGTVPAAGVNAAVLLSDGASRLVDLYRCMDWNQLVELARNAGPGVLIDRTRAIEYSRGSIDDGRARKDHDDATALVAELG